MCLLLSTSADTVWNKFKSNKNYYNNIYEILKQT